MSAPKDDIDYKGEPTVSPRNYINEEWRKHIKEADVTKLIELSSKDICGKINPLLLQELFILSERIKELLLKEGK